ncbi:MAG: tetratricopeptide repeat protein [Caldilineaceae bacterium]|nr:tetratricopeptide repeat protein [Caldilineaceae bacterium]
MNETVVTSVADFQARLQELESDEAGLLYRGQADAVWPVSCSAARRLTQDPANPIEDQLISSLLVGYLEFLIAKARMRGFLPPGFSETSPDLEFLAQLQHQGAATGLIDFTRQPFVALWFACNGAYERDGVVYVLSRSATEEISNSRDLEKKIQSFYEEDTMWSWEPSARGNRIVAQSSVFVFGVSAVASDRMERFIIQADSKRDILTQLDAVYGINEEVLFSDFPGYAVANAANKTFDIRRTISYWREQIELASDEHHKAIAHFNCGDAHSAVKDFKKAAEQYGRAIHFKPDYAEAYSNRGNAEAGLDRYKEAIADYDEAIHFKPDYAEAYCNRGNAKAGLDRYKEAIADYDEAIRINPQHAYAYNNRGLAKVALAQHKEAIADYDKALRINPEYMSAYANRGAAKFGLGQYDEAIADFDKAIGIKPEDAEAYNNRGVVKAELGRHAEALVDFDTAIRFNPRFAEAYKSRGAARAGLGQHEEAIADFDKAIGIKPNYAEAYSNRGTAKAELGRYAEAVADFDAAIHINPEYAEAYRNRGVAQVRLGRHGEAVADFDTAIRIKPDFARAYNSRGIAKAGLGRSAEAIDDFGEAIRIDPRYAEAYANRGLAKKFLRRYAAARDDFERAQTLAHELSLTDLSQRIKLDLDDLNSQDANPPFQIDPHRSGYAEGVAPENLKEILCDLDDDRFAEKNA